MFEYQASNMVVVGLGPGLNLSKARDFFQRPMKLSALSNRVKGLADAFPTLKKSAFFSSNKKVSVLLQLSKNQRSFPAFKKSAFFSNFQKIRVLFFLITYADFLSATSMMYVKS